MKARCINCGRYENTHTGRDKACFGWTGVFWNPTPPAAPAAAEGDDANTDYVHPWPIDEPPAAPAAAEPRSDNVPQFIRDNIERAQQKELSEDMGICYFDAHPHRYQITCYEWKLTPRPVAETPTVVSEILRIEARRKERAPLAEPVPQPTDDGHARADVEQGKTAGYSLTTLATFCAAPAAAEPRCGILMSTTGGQSCDLKKGGGSHAVALESELGTWDAARIRRWKPLAEPVPQSEPLFGDDQIKRMVNRFLTWRLPENFNPDGGISFKPMRNEGTPHAGKNEPVGTNLFDYTQAEEMVRYLLAAPSPAETSPQRTEETKLPGFCKAPGFYHSKLHHEAKSCIEWKVLAPNPQVAETSQASAERELRYILHGIDSRIDELNDIGHWPGCKGNAFCGCTLGSRRIVLARKRRTYAERLAALAGPGDAKETR